MTAGMQPDWKRIGLEGLAFFGRISASISHELKNFLAIVNEQAGILEDLALLAEKGGEVNIERLKSLGGAVQAQVKRADTVVKNMNAFAHSVDTHEACVDIAALVALVMALNSRFAVHKGIELTLVESGVEPGSPPPVWTSPFFLQNLLCLVLWRAMDGVDARKSVCVSVVTQEQSGVQVCIDGLTPVAVSAPEDDRETGLLALLGAELRRDPAGGRLTLALPERTAPPAAGGL